MAEGVFDHIIAVTESDTKRAAVEAAKTYILGNWSGIVCSMTGEDKSVGCSAEGHVSYIYADRMSSRPLGWCYIGVDSMARLRIYRQNKRDVLELVRYQREEFKMAEMPIYTIPYPQIKKKAALRNHIWGL